MGQSYIKFLQTFLRGAAMKVLMINRIDRCKMRRLDLPSYHAGCRPCGPEKNNCARHGCLLTRVINGHDYIASFILAAYCPRSPHLTSIVVSYTSSHPPRCRLEAPHPVAPNCMLVRQRCDTRLLDWNDGTTIPRT